MKRAMEANCSKLTERILQLTLEIIYLLTGEENKNIVVKKSSADGQDLLMVPLRSLLIPESNNEQQILEVTQKIIDLLMRENEHCRNFNVDIEGEIKKEQKEKVVMQKPTCLEGHKELYKDAMMASQPALTSPGGHNGWRSPEECFILSARYNKDDNDAAQCSPVDENCRNFHVDIKDEIQKEQKENVGMQEETSLEGHQELYKDAMMASQPALTSPDVINKRKRLKTQPHPLYSRLQDHIGLQITVKEEQEIEETDNRLSIKTDAIMRTVTKEESSVDVSPGGHNGWRSPEECFILSARYNKDDNDAAQCSPVDFEKFFMQNSPQRIHNGEKRFWCSVCDKSFVNKSGLVQHLRIHTGVRPFSCAVCGKSFIEKSQLNRHNRVHTGVKPFSCPVCGKCFNDKGNREKHVRTHTGGQNVEDTPVGRLIISPHSNKDDNMAPGPPVDFAKLFIQSSPQRIRVKEKRYWCSVCDKSFVNKSGLVQHLRIHSGVRPFSCAVCGKSFIEKSQLNRHQRVHTNEKPFSCPVCGKCFNDKGNREKHVRTHTGEKPFSCTDCGKCFAQNVTLGLHKRTHCTGDNNDSYGQVSEMESLSVELFCDTDEAV